MRRMNNANRNYYGQPGQAKTAIIKFRVSGEWKETVTKILADNGFLYNMGEMTNDQSKFIRRMVMEGMLHNVTPEHIPAIQKLIDEK